MFNYPYATGILWCFSQTQNLGKPERWETIRTSVLTGGWIWTFGSHLPAPQISTWFMDAPKHPIWRFIYELFHHKDILYLAKGPDWPRIASKDTYLEQEHVATAKIKCKRVVVKLRVSSYLEKYFMLDENWDWNIEPKRAITSHFT